MNNMATHKNYIQDLMVGWETPISVARLLKFVICPVRAAQILRNR